MNNPISSLFPYENDVNNADSEFEITPAVEKARKNLLKGKEDATECPYKEGCISFDDNGERITESKAKNKRLKEAEKNIEKLSSELKMTKQINVALRRGKILQDEEMENLKKEY